MVSSEVQKHPGGSSPRTLTSCISQTSKTEMGGLAHFLALLLYQRVFNKLQSTSLSRRRMIWLLPPPLSTLLPPVTWPHRKTEKEKQLAEGEGRSQILWRKESLILYNTLNTLCSVSKNDIHTPQPDIGRGLARTDFRLAWLVADQDNFFSQNPLQA
jgi:hypothetical protein